MTKYSQYDEEPAILNAFMAWPDFAMGRFLDLGAFHPTDLSNTRALYEMGWSGVMIEPSPGPMSSLIAEYGEDPQITLIQAAVGLAEWENPVSVFITDNCVSTVKEAEFAKQRTIVKFIGSILVPVLTLEQIGRRFGEFDFINFDCEGVSVDLFLHSLRLGWHPRCVCVEHESRSEEIVNKAASAGYSVSYSNGTNVVLVRHECA